MLYAVLGSDWYARPLSVHATRDGAVARAETLDVDASVCELPVDADVGATVYVVVNEMDFGGGKAFVRAFTAHDAAVRYQESSQLLETVVLTRQVLP